MTGDASVPLGPPTRWPTAAAIVLAMAGIGLLLYALSLWSHGSPGWGYDFAAYYNAITRYAATGSPYDPATTTAPFQAGPYGLYLYSPIPLVFLLPLGALPADVATWVFVGIRLVVLAATCALMPVSRTLRLAMLGIACLSAPVLFDFDLGNVSLIVTLLAVVAWRWMDRPVAAAAIALAASLRLPMALFGAWWAIRKRWWTLAWLAACAVVLFLISLPFVGLRGWSDYMHVIGNLTGFEAVYRNFALGALAYRATGSETAGTLSLFIGYAVAAGAILLSLRRDRELSYMVTLGATLLLSPLLWDHYLTNILLPAAFVASRGRRWALALPLLCWLPQEALPFVAAVAMLVPFIAPNRGEPAMLAWRGRSSPRPQEPASAAAISPATRALFSIRARFASTDRPWVNSATRASTHGVEAGP